MNIEKQFSELISSPCPHVSGASAKALSYKKMFDEGALSKDEYLELLRDIESEKIIDGTNEQLLQKEALNTLLNNLITAVSLVA